MTLLHQAAQKAVERIRHTLMTGLAHNDAIAALSEIVAMLPQHPDPETRPSMSMFASAADYNAAMDEWLTPPALQHQEEPSTAVIPPAPPECETEDEKTAFAFGYWQGLHAARKGQEVPREPVALTDKQIQDAVFAVLRKWNTDRAWERYTRESGPYDVSSLRPEVLEIIRAVLAASPSTTQQQEVGSAEAWDFTCWRRELVYLIENHYDASDAAKHRTMEAITEHVDAAGMHWRAVTALRDMERRAAAPSTPENAGGVKEGGDAQP